MSDLQWWSAFTSGPWIWDWRPYPGVWVLVAFVGLLYGALVDRLARAGHPGPARARWGWLVIGLLLLWIGLGWPLGALAASHLASALALQHLIVGLVAPCFLVLSVPVGAFRALAGRRRLAGALRSVTHPVVALLIYNGALTVTLWPGVTDLLLRHPVGSFALSLTWISCGLIFWWPVVAPVPARPSLHPLLKVAYLGVSVVFVLPPVAMMFFSESPIYGIYELNPPVGRATPMWDQQRAGAILKVGSAWILAVAMLVVCFGWYSTVKERSEDAGLGVRTSDGG